MAEEQPEEFAGWWELDFYISGGTSPDLGDVIEWIAPDGRFAVYRDGELIGHGRHEDFRHDPPGFTNVAEALDGSGEVLFRELVLWRIEGDRFEVCKAPEAHGRPDRFHSPEGRSIVHAAIRRIADDDPRIPR